MDLRIGVIETPREVSLELADDVDTEALVKQIEAALSGALDVLWLSDKRGKRVAVAGSRIAFVEIGTADGNRKLGFGS